MIALGAVIALACVSAIGAVTTLVVIALDNPASATATLAGDATSPGPSKTREVTDHPMRAPRSSECGMEVWKRGMIYCFGSKSGEGIKPPRKGPAVVVQAQAEESAR